MCQALSLTGINVSTDELHSCHWLNKQDRVIVKFKCRKHRQNALYNRKNLQSKGLELPSLKFSGKLFVNESLSLKSATCPYMSEVKECEKNLFYVVLQQVCKH